MARQTAQQRYAEQIVRRAQPKRQYRVTMRTGDGYEQATTVWAVDEWLARTEAMRACVLDVNGRHVEYVVREITEPRCAHGHDGCCGHHDPEDMPVHESGECVR